MTGSHAVALREVTKAFAGRTLLDRQSTTFAAGSVTVVRGRSGSGKSTLLNLVAGYLTPDSGEIDRPDAIGYLLQEELLFTELDVHDNIHLRIAGALGDQVQDEDAINQALATLEIEALVATPVSRLSGGERRRVEIAAILATAPQVVLLDEPTSGLDPATRETVFEAAWQAFLDHTVILVTHEEHVPGLPAQARSLTLEDGKLS